MLDDISEIDVKVLSKAVHKGKKIAESLTNRSEGGNVVDFYTKHPKIVDFTTKGGKHVRFIVKAGKHVHFVTKVPRVGSHMIKSWYATPIKKSPQGVEKELGNTADYASYVNYGHRIVQGGKTKGWVKGQFMMEKAVIEVEKTMKKEFKKEIERINKEHGN